MEELKRKVASCAAAQQNLAIAVGNAWEPVWEIEDQERAMRVGHKQLKSETVVISRENILSDCQELLEQRAETKARLEIKWENEPAFGTGVSQSFYSEVAKALLKREDFAELWGPEGETSDEASEDLHCVPLHLTAAPLYIAVV